MSARGRIPPCRLLPMGSMRLVRLLVKGVEAKMAQSRRFVRNSARRRFWGRILLSWMKPASAVMALLNSQI